MQPQTTLKLAEETGNIIAVKEASGDMEQVDELIAGRPDGFHVLSGDDALAVPLIEKGGDGLISVVANAYPAYMAEMVGAAMAQDAKRSHRLWKMCIRDSYLIGVNDRRTALFENIWPIPYGVSYNSYLIRDDKCALLDTVEFGSEGAYLDRIEEILGERELDYLVVNHMEPDHSGEIGTVLKRYPSVKLIGRCV